MKKPVISGLNPEIWQAYVYDILLLLLFLCCGSDYYVVYTINGRICRERGRREREGDVIPFLPKIVIPALPK